MTSICASHPRTVNGKNGAMGLRNGKPPGLATATPKTKYLLRTDLARLLEVSVEVIGRNEENLGIVPIKPPAGPRGKPIRYETKATWAVGKIPF